MLSLLLALLWNDLPEKTPMQLTQKIALSQSSYAAGTQLRLKTIEPLAIPVTLLELEEVECAHPEWESEMEIITPLGNSESSAVGVSVAHGCQWSIYVESKDLYTPSFLAPL